ncbi:MAG: HD domain-containing phosphohydrolase [Dehalococcoidales bacterium]|jgi:putative nucleotidyltransferase with HDIG domain
MVSNLGRLSTVSPLYESLDDAANAGLQDLYNLNRRNYNQARIPQMLEQVIKMTQQTLNAAAASILLFRDNNQELYFEAASGPVGKALHQVKLDAQYGIAGQVARTGKPLIVNDVNRSVNFHKMIDDTTGFTTRSLVCAPLTVNHQILGVMEVLNKRDGTTFGEQDLEALVSVATMTAMAIESSRTHQTMLEAYKSTIRALAGAIDAKDQYTKGHSLRVMEYIVKAGAVLCLSNEELELLEYAGMMHDIGKIAVDSSIINKPGPLSPEEWAIMQKHPETGADLCQEIPFLEKTSEIILSHHEKYNGSGYPNGYKGDDIPLGSRLLAVAEAFDTMTTDHSYRAAMSVEEAVKELNAYAGSQFCPVAVKALISALRLNQIRVPAKDLLK